MKKRFPIHLSDPLPLSAYCCQRTDIKNDSKRVMRIVDNFTMSTVVYLFVFLLLGHYIVCLSVYSGVFIVLCFCFVFLRLLYLMLTVSLDCPCLFVYSGVFIVLCFCFVFLRLVSCVWWCPTHIVLCCFGFFCVFVLCIVYPMVPVHSWMLLRFL
jgi:hypothetical protein